MALPELDVARVQRWCAARVPEHARHQVRVECEVAPRHLTIVERRAPWREDFGPEWTSFPIARLRYTAADKSWTLYWRDRNLRFHLYDPSLPRTGSTTSSPRSTATPPASSGGNPQCGQPTAPRPDSGGANYNRLSGLSPELTSPIVDLRHPSAPPRPTHRVRHNVAGNRAVGGRAMRRYRGVCMVEGPRHPRGLITHRRSSNDYLMVTTGQACRGVRRRSESTCLNYVFADFSARSTIRRSRGPW